MAKAKAMDLMELEQERGITIMSKATRAGLKKGMTLAMLTLAAK